MQRGSVFSLITPEQFQSDAHTRYGWFGTVGLVRLVSGDFTAIVTSGASLRIGDDTKQASSFMLAQLTLGLKPSLPYHKLEA